MDLPSQKHESSTSVHLDAMRGVAAVLVALNHLRALFFVEYDQVQHKSYLIKVFYALTGLGHESVMVFFVLSGFLISSSVLRSFKEGRWDWKKYAILRLTRLYAVLLPALLLGGLWDYLGLKLLSGGVYAGGGEYQHILAEPVIKHLSVIDFLGNALFIQDIVVPTFGSNGPLWSLNYEFWYYILFPSLLLLCLPGSAMRVRMICIFLTTAIFLFVGKSIALYFLIWMIGFVVVILPKHAIREKPVFRIISVSCLAGSLFLSRLRPAGSIFIIDFNIAVCVALVIYSVIESHTRIWTTMFYRNSAHRLSNVSYTMYLVHVPFLVFLNSRIIGAAKLWQPDLLHLLYIVCIALFTYMYVSVLWYLFEAKTDIVRKKFFRVSDKGVADVNQKEHVKVG